MCRQGKERNRISNRIGNRIRNNFPFLINQNVSKLQIILMFLSFKAEKKIKKQEKKREDDLQRGKNPENCFFLVIFCFIRDSGFLDLDSGFQGVKFQIPEANKSGSLPCSEIRFIP